MATSLRCRVLAISAFYRLTTQTPLHNQLPLSTPQNCAFPWGDLDSHLIHGSLGSPESSTKNGISIGADVFAGLTSVTDRPTDHATRSVTIGRMYVCSTAMRPKNGKRGHRRPRSPGATHWWRSYRISWWHEQILEKMTMTSYCEKTVSPTVIRLKQSTSGYATWFSAGGAIRIAHYDVIDDVITRKL